MPKKTKSPPPFLLKKLDDKTNDFVRANVAPFMEMMRKQHKGATFDTLQILPDFFDWLGDRDRRFRHLESSQLKTGHKGTYQVYNALRKKIERIEEKTGQTAGAPKVDTPKPTTPGRPKKVKDEEADAALLAADEIYHGHREEKHVPYRRHMGSDQDESDPEVGEEGFEEGEEENPLADKPKFERLRDMLVNLLANYEEDELELLKIEHDFELGTTMVHFQAKQIPE